MKAKDFNELLKSLDEARAIRAGTRKPNRILTFNPKNKVHRGSGNVFVDIGVAHPERVLARAQVMARIADILRERGLTQQRAATLLGIPQSKVSCLMNGKLSMFSLGKPYRVRRRPVT